MMVEHLRRVFAQAESLPHEEQEALAARWEEELEETNTTRKTGSASETSPIDGADKDNSPLEYTAEQWALKRESVRSRMREQTKLVAPESLPLRPGMEDLPSRGSSERAQFETALAEELSDALDRSGLSVLDLIERR